MGLKSFLPTSSGSRWKAISDFTEIQPKNKKPEKSLLESLNKSGGRNNQGRKTSRHRGGGHKQKYRIIDFRRDKHGIIGKVIAIEYDPNRSARIALLQYADNEKRYILAPMNITVGAQVISGSGIEPSIGNALPLKEIPAGTFVHNIELTPGRGGQMARSAGAYATLTAKDNAMVHLKMPSGEVRLVNENCYATVGQIGNIDHMNQSWGKAGRSRWLGWKPSSRAVAKNPVDHPMGGGEGRSSGGRHPCSRSGQFAKGLKTRKRSKPTNRYIIQKRGRIA